jgi:RNA polymerase sigma-70 factor (ECF subfamily)
MSNIRQHEGPDRFLVQAVVDRAEERAFRNLYQKHAPRLFLFMLRLFGGGAAAAEHEAEDAVQETWLRACEKLDRFRWDSSFSTWLHAIGLNVARDLLRRRSRQRSEPRGEREDPRILAPPFAERIDLERAIAALPDGYRLVLVLHDIEGMKHREIAGQLGISEGTSKSQLFGARRLVRGMLSGIRERSAQERDHA